MPRLRNFLTAARDNALIVLAFVFCLVFCVVMVASFTLAVLSAVAGAAVLGAWDRLRGHSRRP